MLIHCYEISILPWEQSDRLAAFAVSQGGWFTPHVDQLRLWVPQRSVCFLLLMAEGLRARQDLDYID